MVRLMLNKGFSVIEVLIILIIIGLFNFLTFNQNKGISLNDQSSISNLSNSLLLLQMESLNERQKNCLTDNKVIADYPICFNHNGNPNMAQKIYISNSRMQITIFLGSGSHEIK